MDRRKFLKDLAAATAATSEYLSNRPEPAEHSTFAVSSDAGVTSSIPDIEGHTFICAFELDLTTWKVYEDLRIREGSITFISSNGGSRVLQKSAEASFPDARTPYLGLELKDIGTSPSDLLANRLLETEGDPDPEKVRSAALPLGSSPPATPSWRLPWDTFVGTRECFDTMPVFPSGATRTYHPAQYCPELTNEGTRKRFDGLVGGWMPSVRKVIALSESAHLE